MKLIYTDTTTPEYQYVAFNDDIPDWQYVCGTVVPKRADKTLQSITVSLACDYNANRAYMDNISLIEEPVQTYTYDSEGNQTLASNGQGKTSTTYDSSNRLTKYTSMSGVSYSLTYSGTNRDASTVTSDGVKITYTYDSAGNVTLSKTQATSGGAYLQSSASYDSTKNFKTSSTDINGSTTQATYSTTKGLVTSTTAANNTVTNQTYYNNDRNYMSYVSGVAAVVNTYNGNGLISRLARKTFLGQAAQWQAYDFEYNDWGQTTSISIRHTNSEDGSGYSSGLKLADYAYADDGGNLEKLTYGNDQYVEYFYDLFDRLVHTVYYDKNDTIQAEYFYVYNAAGQLARQYAVSGGAVTEEYSFSYDSLGRLIRSMELGADGTVKQRTQHLYDTANRLTSQSWTVGNDTYTESYTYYSGDGSLKAVTTATGDKLTYAYDGLKRMSTATVTNGSGTTLFYTAQNYTDISSSRTTTRPMYYNTRQADGTLLSGNKYEYDAAGNITAIRNSTENFPLLAAYEYDGLNQLTKETRYTYNSAGTQSSTEITYTYDTAGNLLTKTDGSTTSTYTYGNSDWADLLTAFNGQPITYEMEDGKPTGNPTTWHNTTINDYYDMTWEKGRQLSGLKVWGTSQPVSIAYSYDMEGIRTQKTIGNEVHNYITQNGRVIEEAYGNIILKFFYDTNGKPFALRYSNDSGGTWTTMYYVLNLQGDVVKLIGTDGSYYNVYATYTYDAWGNVLSAVSTYTNVPKFANIAQINPLRYRGYYYDTETGFYYLQSRYYDPTVCRFINADSYASTGQGVIGYNMFAYCNNMPVLYADSEGTVASVNLMVTDTGGSAKCKYVNNTELPSETVQYYVEEELRKIPSQCVVSYEGVTGYSGGASSALDKVGHLATWGGTASIISKVASSEAVAQIAAAIGGVATFVGIGVAVIDLGVGCYYRAHRREQIPTGSYHVYKITCTRLDTITDQWGTTTVAHITETLTIYEENSAKAYKNTYLKDFSTDAWYEYIYG